MSRAERPAFFPWGATTGRPVLAPPLDPLPEASQPTPTFARNADAISARPIHVRHLTERKVECRCHFAEDIVPLPQDSCCCSISSTGSPQVTHSQLRLAPVSRHSTLQMGLARTIRSLSAKGCGPPFLPDPAPSPSRQLSAAASADQIGQPEAPTFELTTDGALARCAAFRRRRAGVDRFTPHRGRAPPTPR